MPVSALETSLASSSPESDEALMLRIGQGDQKAFSLLVARHMAGVIATGWRLSGSKAEGEDIAQEAFAKLWINAAKWRPASEGGTAKFSTWLYRVVVNLSIDRKRRAHPEVMAQGVSVEDAPDVADGSDDALTALTRREASEEVAQAINRLPARQREVLVLCFYEGVGNAEAAKILSLSVGAVESLLVRAKRRLREELAHLQGE